MPHPAATLALAQRLERAEASANAAFVDARALAAPAIGAEWRDFDGTWAMFDGVGSPLTQTFGFGVFAEPSREQLDALETFFFARGADAMHEVSPLAGPAALAALAAHGYVAIEQSTVLCLALDEAPAAVLPDGLAVRPITPAEHDWWASLASDGWGETPELAAFMRDFGGITARSRGCTCFVASLDGMPVATGALSTHAGVALFAGASTVPAWRRRGAQAALLTARLRAARELGCDLAMMVAAPGSTSQVNAERAGFRPCYTRTKWCRAFARDA